MKLLLIAATLLAFCLHGFAQLPEYPVATLAVTTTDESNKPIPRAAVTGVFTWPKTFEQHVTHVDKQTTNALGNAVVSGQTESGGCSIEALKEGFYFSGRRIEFNASADGKWQPSPRQENLILKKVGAPIPMYAVANWPIVLPGKSGKFGFDLEKRDWTAPHGAGVKADLVFTQEVKEDAVVGSTATLRVNFSNRGDGLIPLFELQGAESELKLPRTAPVGGYEPERNFTTTWSASRGLTRPSKPALGYIFRVRTVLDENGEVKSAWYGKIDGEFDWDPRNFPTAQLTFTYYLNPDGTPNLEFDRKQNLFGELPVENLVRRP